MYLKVGALHRVTSLEWMRTRAAVNHLPITKWSRERTDQCLEEKEGEGAEIEELEPGNGQQAGKRLGRLLRTSDHHLGFAHCLAWTWVNCDASRPGGWVVPSRQWAGWWGSSWGERTGSTLGPRCPCTSAASEQHTWSRRILTTNIHAKSNVYLREDEDDDADSKADNDQTENIFFWKLFYENIKSICSQNVLSYNALSTCILSTPPSHTPPAPGWIPPASIDSIKLWRWLMLKVINSEGHWYSELTLKVIDSQCN